MNPQPVFVLDTSAIAYQLAETIESLLGDNIDRETYRKFTKANLRWIENLGFYPSMQGCKSSFVWALDSKPYWRSKIYPEYKGNRKTTNLKKEKILDIVLAELNGKGIGELGFEADDIAAAAVKLTRRPIYLLTCDTDWMGLVSDRVTWLNTYKWAPRARTPQDCANWLLKRIPAKHRHDLKLQPTDIWIAKQRTGDSSDNLLPGCDPSLIDLFNPHPDWVSWKRPSIRKSILDTLAVITETSQDYSDKLVSAMWKCGLSPFCEPIRDKPLLKI